MKTMRQHLNRLERKLSKYPEEKRRFTSGKGSRRPVLELASDIVFEEFSEDINEVQKKYDVIIEWEAHSLFEERIPLIKVTISPEHPFFKEHLEKVGSGWHVLAPTNSVEKGTPIVRLYSKREDKQDRTALIASRFQVQYVGYLDMTLEDIILERLQSYWKKMVESLKEAKSIDSARGPLRERRPHESLLHELHIELGQREVGTLHLQPRLCQPNRKPPADGGALSRRSQQKGAHKWGRVNAKSLTSSMTSRTEKI